MLFAPFDIQLDMTVVFSCFQFLQNIIKSARRLKCRNARFSSKGKSAIQSNQNMTMMVINQNGSTGGIKIQHNYFNMQVSSQNLQFTMKLESSSFAFLPSSRKGAIFFIQFVSQETRISTSHWMDLQVSIEYRQFYTMCAYPSDGLQTILLNMHINNPIVRKAQFCKNGVEENALGLAAYFYICQFVILKLALIICSPWRLTLSSQIHHENQIKVSNI